MPVQHPEIDYPGSDILCFRGPVPAGSNADAMNAVVMSNVDLDWDRPETWTAMIDRSPCGTGTCAVSLRTPLVRPKSVICIRLYVLAGIAPRLAACLRSNAQALLSSSHQSLWPSRSWRRSTPEVSLDSTHPLCTSR